MKKLTVIAAMALLSITTMTACGNKENKTKDNQTNITDQDSTNSNDNNTDNNVDDSNTNDNDTNADNLDDSYGGADPDLDSDYNQDKDTDDNTKDPEDNVDDNKVDDTNTDKEDNTDAENNNVSDGNANDEKNKDNQKDKDKGNNEQKELVETGKEPDFKLNKKGCFNGNYEGNDGCTYKFTKKGKLIITSDSETLKYEYTLSGDVLSMIAEDGSFGTSRQITLLEDGTYLLDDKMGTQVILTYIES